VLEAAKSSYLGPFQTLSSNIHRSNAESTDNLRFLNSLTDPCEKIEKVRKGQRKGLREGGGRMEEDLERERDEEEKETRKRARFRIGFAANHRPVVTLVVTLAVFWADAGRW
jgi:hypothetical protein